MTAATSLLAARDAAVVFRMGRGRRLHALTDVSFDLRAGETLGVIGESGSGKSTLARAVMGLVPLAGGRIEIDGATMLGRRRRSGLKALARKVQIVFQDPAEALDPRLTVAASVAEPLRVAGRAKAAAAAEVARLLDQVGLYPALGTRLPHELSGGQRPRACISRALALRPEVLICDEAVSALDVSIRAEILNLLLDLQQENGYACLFISHDIAVVSRMADRIGVMYLGRLIETGTAEEVLSRPAHPYTEALLAAEPEALPSAMRRPKSAPIRGELPNPLDPPAGCAFRTRCPYARGVCATPPPLHGAGTERTALCHLAGELNLAGLSLPPTSARPVDGKP
jgi:oligopeptide/dipeptide ABC transporter ATP-binding protein